MEASLSIYISTSYIVFVILKQNSEDKQELLELQFNVIKRRMESLIITQVEHWLKVGLEIRSIKAHKAPRMKMKTNMATRRKEKWKKSGFLLLSFQREWL